MRSIWLRRLALALRTAMACTVVACSALYGPEKFRHTVVYPSLSYVTAILVLFSDTITLGETLSGCFRVLCATVQTLALTVPTFCVMGTSRLNHLPIAAAAVAATVFLVATTMPRSMGILARRMAFGQVVIVYVGVVARGGKVGAVMHPVHVAASTTFGALASILAVSLPWPPLANHELKEACRLYAENALARLNLMVEALRTENRILASDLISQMKSFSSTGRELLQMINIKYEGMLWERPDIRFAGPKELDPREKWQNKERLIWGMELALDSCDSFPVKIIDEELKQDLLSSHARMGQKIEQTKCLASSDPATAPETNEEAAKKPLWSLKPSFMSHQELPLCFFWHCMELFKSDSPIKRAQKSDEKYLDKRSWFWADIFRHRLRFALKCSISLGLAVLCGMMYNRENGYWSGLTIAISFVTRRQATFTMANSRLQGTAMGSVYALLCCFVFGKLAAFRFLLLIPWIIFTSFLRHSKMYGQSGAISAVIGALLILGRKNYGAPNEFAITRLTEAAIGLICFILVEILFERARATTLARTQLLRCLEELLHGIQSLSLLPEQLDISTADLQRAESRLRYHISSLEDFIEEAELEPNFWFRPFHGASYKKILRSFTRVTDLLLFIRHQVESLSQSSEKLDSILKELNLHMADNLKRLQEDAKCSLKCLRDVMLIKSAGRDLWKPKIYQDIDQARETSDGHLSTNKGPDEKDRRELSEFLLQNLREAANKIYGSKCDDETLKSQTVLGLGGLGFCVSRLVLEITGIAQELRELDKWENPTQHIQLREISCIASSPNAK